MPEEKQINSSNPTETLKKILFFGDSLTAGFGLPAHQSFPSLVQEKINREKLPYRTINAGLSGETSAGAKTRIVDLLNEPIAVFVLELGINDVLRGITVEQTLANLQFVIDFVKIKQPGAKMLLLGMELPHVLTGQILMDFRMIFRHLAQKNNMAFLPFLLNGVVGNRLLNLQDGVHPNAKGYEIIAGNIWPILKILL